MIVHVFHRNELWLESADWVPTTKLPPHAYIRRQSSSFSGAFPVWYLTQRFGTADNALPISKADVPEWVRTCCLLLNLQV